MPSSMYTQLPLTETGMTKGTDERYKACSSIDTWVKSLLSVRWNDNEFGTRGTLGGRTASMVPSFECQTAVTSFAPCTPSTLSEAFGVPLRESMNIMTQGVLRPIHVLPEWQRHPANDDVILVLGGQTKVPLATTYDGEQRSMSWS
jgi:hypothetical protein